MRSWVISAAAGVVAALVALVSDAAVVVWQALAVVGLVPDAGCGSAETVGGVITQPMCTSPGALRILAVLTPLAAALMAASMSRRITRSRGAAQHT